MGWTGMKLGMGPVGLRSSCAVVGLLTGLGWGVACGDTAEQSCMIGALDCACTAGGACDAGLDCVGDVCIVLDNATDSGPMTNDPSMTSGASASTTARMSSGDTTGSDDTAGDGLILDVGNGETEGDPVSGCRAVDVLFALDSSGSMIEERNALAATNAFSQILVALEGLNGGGINYRVGLTTANDHGFITPTGWIEPDPWFDSEAVELDTMSLAFNGAAGQIGQLGDPPAGCEHALTSAVNLLASDTTGFVRDDALLVLVLLTDVDDFGAYDQADGNDCGFGCGTAPSDLDALRTLLVDSVKAGQEEGVAVVTVAGDPTVDAGLNFCGQPGSCDCTEGGDCAVFHATRLYEFAESLGAQGITADLCGANVPSVVEEVLTSSVDQLCQDFQPEG